MIEIADNYNGLTFDHSQRTTDVDNDFTAKPANYQNTRTT